MVCCLIFSPSLVEERRCLQFSSGWSTGWAPNGMSPFSFGGKLSRVSSSRALESHTLESHTLESPTLESRPPECQMERKAQLRAIVQDSIGKHMFQNAIFFANQLLASATHQQHDDAHLDDVYLLAQAYLFTNQYRRTLHLLEKYKKSTQHIPRFRLITAKCLAQCEEWDECLAVLDEETIKAARAEDRDACPPEEQQGAPDHIGVHSAMRLLCGNAYEVLENWKMAAASYCDALRAEPYNFEALSRLVDGHMLTVPERQALLVELEPILNSSGYEWLKVYYSCKLLPESGRKLADMHSRAQALKIDGSGSSGDNSGSVLGSATAKEEELTAAANIFLESDASSNAETLNLQANCDLMIAAAECEYNRERLRECFELSSRVLAIDPFAWGILPIHICAMTRLRQQAELYALAHRLVEEYPEKGIPWFAVGSYYYLVSDFESARRYFSKAAMLEPRFAPAYVGSGHAFAAQDESDQAMAAYRTASRLFPGSYVPWLGIGMEYLRTSHLPLALQNLQKAETIAPNNPQVLHELGVVHYVAGEYGLAARFFENALRIDEYNEEAREPSMFNLGHAHRKLREYSEAIKWYESALAIRPRSASTFSALGFTHHLQGSLDTAIELYHQALSLKPDDTFTSEMLTEALKKSSFSLGVLGSEEFEEQDMEVLPS